MRSVCKQPNSNIPMRGDCVQPDVIELKRPAGDMGSIGVSERQKANLNWAEILYQGESQKRAY